MTLTKNNYKVNHKFKTRFLKDIKDIEKQRSGGVTKDKPYTYKPDIEQAELIERIQRAYNVGEYNLTKPLQVFSDRSVLEVDEESHKILNIYKPEIAKEISDAWKSDVRRPISRNKVVAVVAHQLHKLIIPSVKAQTPDDKHDEYAAQAMRDILDYIRYKIKYKQEMMYVLLEATASPLTIVETGYATLYKQLKSRGEDGDVSIELVVDKYLSEFYMSRHSISEILIPSIDESDIQKQEWVIRRKLISIDKARARWGLREKFGFVREGVYYKFSKDRVFYEDKKDSAIVRDDLRFVEEVTFYSRYTDTYAVVLNGVLVTDIDEGIPRSDGLYNFVTIGYEPITREASFYHYPFILKLTEDQNLLEDMYNITMDGAKLDIMPPTAVTQALGGANVVPGASVVVREDFKATPLTTNRNSSAGFNAIQLIENSFEQVSPSHQAGVSTPGEKTRKEVELLDSNAQTVQALFKAQFESFVVELTQLFIGDIQDYITKDAYDKITHSQAAESILIPQSFEKGSAISKEIKFVSAYANNYGLTDRSYNLLEQELHSNKQITEIEPLGFLNIEFSSYIQPEQISAQDPERKERIARDLYILLKDNPTIELDELTRNLLSVFSPFQVDEIMKDPALLKELKNQVAQPPEGGGVKSLGGEDNQPVNAPGMPVT